MWLVVSVSLFDLWQEFDMQQEFGLLQEFCSELLGLGLIFWP